MKKQQIKSIKKFIPHISASLLSILAVACVIFRVMSSPLDYNEAMVCGKAFFANRQYLNER